MTVRDVFMKALRKLDVSDAERMALYADFIEMELAHLRSASDNLVVLGEDGVARPYRELYPEA